MAAFWGMIFLSMADDSIFYPILWIMLIISLFVSVMALWKWKKERQRKCQHRGNHENSRVWDFRTSSQHLRMHSSVPRKMDKNCEILDQFNRRLQALTRCMAMLTLELPEGSDDSTSSVTVSENRCSLRTSLYPLSTSCGEMEAPYRHPKAQENLESSIPERKAEQGLGLSDQRKPDVMVAPTVQDLPLEDEAMQSHLEHPNIKMQAPQFLKRSFSEPCPGSERLPASPSSEALKEAHLLAHSSVGMGKLWQGGQQHGPLSHGENLPPRQIRADKKQGFQSTLPAAESMKALMTIRSR
ncbi:uncharacterized protein LOC121113195 [Gallus gallus]|uniref:uncharacterized protein LOC121113195 n=1 Tax=Gallus gallus TaxID=9031 RepID=UPI001AE893F6|nr:uncharacterized protein LOC121113195 [Gallus gallus]